MRLHNNKKLVSWPEKLPYRPSMAGVAAYMKDDETMNQLRDHVSLRPMIPMPTQVSPIYVLLMHDPKYHPWTERFTDTYRSIISLESILRLYCEDKDFGFSTQNEELAKKVFARFTAGLDSITEKHYADFRGIDAMHKDPGMFRKLVIATTFKLIHHLEECLYVLFIETFGQGDTIALKDCLTPINKNPKSISLPQHSQDLFAKLFVDFFERKEEAGTKMLKKKNKKKFFTNEKDIWPDYLKFEIFQLQQARLKK